MKREVREVESGSEDEDSDEIVNGGRGMEQTKLFMWYFDQCDPKKCSGMALKKLGMLRTLPLKAKFNGIVLTPATKTMISMADANLLLEHGASVIDCSWAFFD